MDLLRKLFRKDRTTIKFENLEIDGKEVVEATLTISDPQVVRELADYLESRLGEETTIDFDFKNANFAAGAPRFFTFKLNPESVISLV